MTTAEKLQTIAENVPRVYEAGKEAGKKSEYDKFWDAYQNYGNKNGYPNAFYNWRNDCYNPKYPIYGKNTSTTSIFQWGGMTDTLVDVILLGTSDASYAFRYSDLKTIRKIICEETVNLYKAFEYTYALENITFEGSIGGSDIDFQWSTKLTKASILSIVNALSVNVTGRTLTLSQTAVDNAFGGSTSAEWLALVANRSNWSILLS